MFSVWEKEGWEASVIEERYGEAARTTVILSFNKKATIKCDGNFAANYPELKGFNRCSLYRMKQF